jgi:DNA double-strand break repair helicase HerA and related ATPase
MPSFTDTLTAGYGFPDPSVTLGAALEGTTVHPEPKVRIPLAMINRHGLIAGATGTGKTRTLQLLAEQPTIALPGGRERSAMSGSRRARPRSS